MLKITGISKTFNKGTINEKLALDELSITINDGDFITVIGGNGAGKSTLLNAICGTIAVESGSIELDGKDITHLKEAKRAKYLGRVFQDPMMGTCADMSVEENLALAVRRGKTRSLKWGMPKKDREVYVEELAKLNLSYTVITAPCSGTTSAKNVQPGELLMPGMSLFSIVDDSNVWVIANFRESQIRGIEVGSKVDILVDAFRGEKFIGEVVAVADATGAQYSAMAPDNATGNFVKVEQRIPVKIAFTKENSHEKIARLSSGMNVECKVRK